MLAQNPHGPRAGTVPRAGTTNIDATGGLDAYFRERDDDKKNCFHINKTILPDFSRRYS